MNNGEADYQTSYWPKYSEVAKLGILEQKNLLVNSVSYTTSRTMDNLGIILKDPASSRLQ
jgi:hypothetical protein